MGGFFGAITKQDCVLDVFFGTDYHSLLCLLRHRRGRYLLHLAFIVYRVDYQGI